MVSFYYLVKDIEVQWKSIGRVDLLNKFLADGTTNSVVMVQHLKALGTESVTTVNKYPRNLVTNIEVVSAIIAEVKTSGFIVTLNLDNRLSFKSFLSQFLFLGLSFFSKAHDFSPCFIGVKAIVTLLDYFTW